MSFCRFLCLLIQLIYVYFLLTRSTFLLKVEVLNVNLIEKVRSEVRTKWELDTFFENLFWQKNFAEIYFLFLSSLYKLFSRNMKNIKLICHRWFITVKLKRKKGRIKLSRKFSYGQLKRTWKTKKEWNFYVCCENSLRSHVTTRLRDQKIRKHGQPSWLEGKEWREKFPNSVITQN